MNSNYEGLLRRLRTPPTGHAEQTDSDKLSAATAIESLEFQLAARIEKAKCSNCEASLI